MQSVQFAGKTYSSSQKISQVKGCKQLSKSNWCLWELSTKQHLDDRMAELWWDPERSSTIIWLILLFSTPKKMLYISPRMYAPTFKDQNKTFWDVSGQRVNFSNLYSPLLCPAMFSSHYRCSINSIWCPDGMSHV